MGGGPEDESISAISDGIENILKKLGKKDTRYSINLRDYGFDDDEISSFDGVNIYKVVTSTIMKKYDPWIAGVKISRNDVLKAVREEFKPGQLAEYFEIRDDGTLKLTQDYYQSKDQYLYPKNIPPVAIKFIWVRVDDFKIDRSRYVEFKKAGAKELPGESKEKINRIREILTNLGGALEEMIEDDDDLIEIREELEGYGETEAAELIQSYLNLSKEEREDKTKEYREKFYEMEGYVLEDWGEEKVTGDWEWGKLPSARANMLFGDPKQLSLFERILSESSHVDIIVRNFEQALVEEFPQLERLHIHYRKSNNSLYFAEIKIKKEFRGQGIGSKVLKKINQFADDQNLTVTLIPEPEPRHKADLLKFYKSHDFVQNKGRNRDYRISDPFAPTMYRKPKKSLKEMILETHD
jgi:GNAT superfamily N-acetyltransferase